MRLLWYFEINETETEEGIFSVLCLYENKKCILFFV